MDRTMDIDGGETIKQGAGARWATLAGFCASLVGIGLARFAYTPLLPAIVGAHWFEASVAAYLGAANLAGYLAGALLGRPIAARWPVAATLRAMMVLATVAFFACAYPLSFAWFFAWRFLAGLAGGALMVLAAPAVLPLVPAARRGLAGGVIFMGVGVGVAASGTLVPLLLAQGLRDAWLGLGVLSVALTAIAWKGWPRDGAAPPAPAGQARPAQARPAQARPRRRAGAWRHGTHPADRRRTPRSPHRPASGPVPETSRPQWRPRLYPGSGGPGHSVAPFWRKSADRRSTGGSASRRPASARAPAASRRRCRRSCPPFGRKCPRAWRSLAWAWGGIDGARPSSGTGPGRTRRLPAAPRAPSRRAGSGSTAFRSPRSTRREARRGCGGHRSRPAP